ncbi:hypothetical protein HOT36_gp17 [Ralstonia phage RPSC1]|uniref:Uncharacterized protein n=1 Tax=Ralstonia phage RPSC1 TaxID=2041351 RepID=A0A2Z2U7V7_9CAUD|nr:hypothetical protein HOT36_gp17 [Ralstonia phage RPSC1]ATN92947.1 hypothetical protein RPSC1_16 [Ralstonia phage RPSC1]
MGIPYEQARAAGLTSAAKGREAYEKYASSVNPTTPSQRLLGSTPPTWDGCHSELPYEHTASRSIKALAEAALAILDIPVRHAPDPFNEAVAYALVHGFTAANVVHSMDAAMLNSWKTNRPMRAGDTLKVYGERGQGKSVAAVYWRAMCDGMDTDLKSKEYFAALATAYHTSVLKPCRKEKPE